MEGEMDGSIGRFRKNSLQLLIAFCHDLSALGGAADQQSEDLGVKTRNKNRGDCSLGIVVRCH